MPELVYVSDPSVCCDDAWEEAYKRYETPEQARKKIERRLSMFGVVGWDRNARIVELFCGSGPQLQVLDSMGFPNLEGVDLSANLLELYEGRGRCYVADCRELPFEDDDRDLMIVDGGLHHLPSLSDLEKCLREVCRVLTSEGRFYALEPWNTWLLRSVRFFSRQPWVRSLSTKLDAFETMLEHESETYERWLSQPAPILELFHDYFEPTTSRISTGHLIFVGSPRKERLRAPRLCP